jgi:hypothetical protein
VPSAAYELKWAAHPRFVEPLRAYAERLVGNDPQTEQPVYLSRSHLKRRKRQIVGEKEFEAILESKGFLVVHPEELTIEEQIKTINRHRHIFAANGSAAHLIVFSLHRPHLHLLTQERVSQDFFLCSAIADVPTTMIQCLDLFDGATSGATALTVNFDSVLRYLHDEGFGSSTSALAGSLAA